MKKRINCALGVAFLVIITIVIYGIVTGLKIQEANQITGSFVKIPLDTKFFVFPWILVFLFACIIVYLHCKK